METKQEEKRTERGRIGEDLNQQLLILSGMLKKIIIIIIIANRRK